MQYLRQLFHIETDYSKRVFGLDVMRMIGIILVIEAHAFHLVQQYVPKWFVLVPLLDKVNFSFMLSGFLIGSTIVKLFQRDDFAFDKIKRFWVRRWLRTIPVYYVVITVMVILRYSFTTVGFVFPWQHYFFVQNIYNPEPDPYYFYPEAWSLAVEEWFYVAFPALLWMLYFLCSKFLSRKNIMVVVIVAVILFCTTLRYYKAIVTPDLTIHDWNIWFRKIVFFRLDTLMFGVLAAFIKFYFADFWNQQKAKFFIISLALFAITLLGYPYFVRNSFWLKTFYLTQVSIAVAFLLPMLDSMKAGKGFWLKWVTFISKISFCIYLLNRTPILQTMMILFPTHIPILSAFIYLMYLIVLIISATLMHKFVERYILEYRDKIT